MQQLVLTVIGQDRPGLLEELSSVILSHHGNWLASNLSHLAGKFAGIVQVEVAEEHLRELQDALHSIAHLEIRVESGELTDATTGEQINLVITGNDRPGIVQELATVIRHKGANITHLTSKQQSAPNWGVPIFSAMATVSLPAGMSRDVVVEALESITSDVIVDIEN
ncbi:MULTISPECIES: ACT domain-containing protein [unclassified Pseudoalteromonas]|uniref:glycine cleavage system protein R n=1 Tax=unclassified Pseudoalteromonas TaxID=194690 RepID=UPI000CF6DAB2|nr:MULTISPECIES: ACT domain-containing protein [unclassified Pseudoalteromonas]MBS3797371.1 glycine cleavage system protein R [Pseudoalteromonas sp. BDTF-M6]